MNRRSPVGRVASNIVSPCEAMFRLSPSNFSLLLIAFHRDPRCRSFRLRQRGTAHVETDAKTLRDMKGRHCSWVMCHSKCVLEDLNQARLDKLPLGESSTERSRIANAFLGRRS